MKLFERIIQKLHYLSLDVVFGAVCSQYMFWRLSNEKINLPTILSLACATWLIYILDRLLDKPKIETKRHSFHTQNRIFLFFLCAFLLFILLLNCYFLPKIVFKNGLILGFITAFYLFVFVYWLRFYWLKEITTAIIYTAAITLPPYWLSGQTNWILCFIFFLIAFQNLLLFSWFEYQHNPANKNILHILGIKITQTLIFAFTACVVLSCFMVDFNTDSLKIYVIEIVMSCCLLLMFYYHNFFQKNERYRFCGDAIFVIPLLLAL